MDALVTAIATLSAVVVGGFISLEVTRRSTLATLQAQRDERAAASVARALEFQRTTLLDLQDALYRLLGGVINLTSFGHDEPIVPETWRSINVVNADVDRLVVRVSDERVRELTTALTTETSQMLTRKLLGQGGCPTLPILAPTTSA